MVEKIFDLVDIEGGKYFADAVTENKYYRCIYWRNEDFAAMVILNNIFADKPFRQTFYCCRC